jgi:hypothetical protein
MACDGTMTVGLRIAALGIVLLICAVAVLLFLVLQPRTDRIVDCAPGFHNVSGPSSECVPN